MKFAVFLIVYIVGLSITHGYIQKNDGCFSDNNTVDKCSVDAVAGAIIWPVYWAFHSGTLMFEPTEEDR